MVNRSNMYRALYKETNKHLLNFHNKHCFQILVQRYSRTFCLQLSVTKAATYTTILIALRLSFRIIINSEKPVLFVLQFDCKAKRFKRTFLGQTGFISHLMSILLFPVKGQTFFITPIPPCILSVGSQFPKRVFQQDDLILHPPKTVCRFVYNAFVKHSTKSCL